MFHGNLWQKESALRVIDDQKAMAPNLNGFGKNWLQRREQRNLDAHLLELGLFHGSKARIFERSAHGAANDSLAKGLVGLGYTNASLQAPSHINCDEDSAQFGKKFLTRYGIRKLAVQDSFANSLAG